MKKVNLFSIGAMRAGSTTLYVGLSQHPDIYMPSIKEPYYFKAEVCRLQIQAGGMSEALYESAQSVINGGLFRTKEKYESLYEKSGQEKWLGDCSHYIYTAAAAKLIHRYNSNARILCSVRNPVDRIYSEFMLNARQNMTNTNFNNFIKKNVKKRSDGQWESINHSVFHKGFYAGHLEPWLSVFTREQIKVIRFEDLQNFQTQTFQDVYHWLGLDSSFCPVEVRAQRGGVSKSAIVSRLIDKYKGPKKLLKKIIPLQYRWKIRDAVYAKLLVQPKMSEEVEDILRSIYRPEVEKLEDMLQLDLSAEWWG